MAKSLPLVKRLEIALGQTGSDSGKNRVYARLHHTASLADGCDSEEFYGSVVPRMMSHQSYQDITPKPADIDLGKKLALRLERAIAPLLPPSVLDARERRSAGSKIQRAKTAELELIRRFYESL